jgi:hypothetical protein
MVVGASAPARVGRCQAIYLIIAGWSSLVARRAHNPKVAGSNPAPATKLRFRSVVVNMPVTQEIAGSSPSRTAIKMDDYFLG